MKKLLKLFTLAMVLMISGLTLVACGNSKPKVEEPSQEDDRIMVSFDTCGGNQIAPQEIDENGIVEKVYPQRDDYVFMGWYLDKKYRQEFDFNTSVDKNLTLYAKWTNNLCEVYDFQFTNEYMDSFTINAYYGESDTLVLPDMYCGMPVVAIDANVFNGNDDLCKLTIPESIVQIGSGAFKDCLKLNDLQILGKSLCENEAFCNCRNLRSIYVKNGLLNKNQYNNGIFSDAGVDGNGITLTIGTRGNYLHDFQLPLAKGILLPYANSTSSNTYRNIPKITKIEFADDVDFYGFTSDYLPYIEEIKVDKPFGYTGGLPSPFASYINLRKVIIENEITSIPSYAFRNCKKLSTIILPNTISDIGSYAFADCESLTSITIPSSVGHIGNNAFEGCTNLKSMNYLGTLTDWLQVEIGGNTANPIYYTKKLVIQGEEITDIIIPENIEEINYCAFYNCKNLNSVIIPKSVKRIESYAFAGCSETIFYCERPEPTYENESEIDSDEYNWDLRWGGLYCFDNNGEIVYSSKIIWNYTQQ